MINIDFLTLKAFFLENIDFIIGSHLQKIQQPTRRDFILFLRNNGSSRKLYINIYPQIYHIAFMSKENEEKRNIEIPQKPPMFCMLLRKHIEGARITDASVIENERILELLFETYDEISQKQTLCLAVEFMGKHSNIILYDKKNGVIIGCAHNVGAEKSRYRELRGGLKYIYPPNVNIKNTGILLSNELKKQFENLSSEKINEYLSETSFRPAIKDNRYTLFKELIDASIPQNSVNRMLDDYYANFQERLILKEEKSKLTEITSTKLKKAKNAISKITSLLEKRDNTENYKRYGEYQKKDYQKCIEVYDYINNQNITIDLDNTKTLNENAQRYFKLYAKSKKTKEKSNKMLSELKIELDYLENVIYSINSTNSVKELDEIKTELGLNTEKIKKNEKPTIEKTSINGFDVYIGKNNKQNDYIVSKLAKDEDFWFHTRLCAGSHILLKINGTEPDEETIFECCKLARKYSSASQPSKVGVIYTKAKYLRKPPAAPLGYVTYKNEKEVLI